MLVAIVLVLNGAFLPSAPPARRERGHVLAPLAPAVARMVDRATLDGETIVLVRGGRTCVFHLAWRSYRCDAEIRLADVAPVEIDGTVYLPIATVARAFGGEAGYDGAHRTLALVLPPVPASLAPPTPAPGVPAVAPTAVFTPQPPPPTPQVVLPGEPRPRRTAIPATPSRVPL